MAIVVTAIAITNTIIIVDGLLFRPTYQPTYQLA